VFGAHARGGKAPLPAHALTLRRARSRGGEHACKEHTWEAHAKGRLCWRRISAPHQPSHCWLTGWAAQMARLLVCSSMLPTPRLAAGLRHWCLSASNTRGEWVWVRAAWATHATCIWLPTRVATSDAASDRLTLTGQRGCSDAACVPC